MARMKLKLKKGDFVKVVSGKDKGKQAKILRTIPDSGKVVLEVGYEEIQKSPTYSSGYALRFPRLVRLRVDKGPDDASTLKQVERLYEGQRGRK